MPHVTSPTWGPPPSCKQTLISFAAVFRLVTQNSFPEECCVTSLITAAKETKVNRVCSTVTLPMEFEFFNFKGRQILQLRTQRSSESTLRFFFKKRQFCVTKFILVDPRISKLSTGRDLCVGNLLPSQPGAYRTLRLCQKCLCSKCISFSYPRYFLCVPPPGIQPNFVLPSPHSRRNIAVSLET